MKSRSTATTAYRYVYATEEPYGIYTLNRDGNRPNLLHRFDDRQAQYDFVDADREHRNFAYPTSPLVTRVLRRTTPQEWPAPYFD